MATVEERGACVRGTIRMLQLYAWYIVQPYGPTQAVVTTIVRTARNYSQHVRTNFAPPAYRPPPQEPSHEYPHTRSETHIPPVRSDTFESRSRRRASK